MNRDELKFETQQLEALTEATGFPGMDLNRICIRIRDFDVLLPGVAEEHQVLVVLTKGERLFVAMKNPGDLQLVSQLEFSTGKKVFAYIALGSALARVIREVVVLKAEGRAHFVGAACPENTWRKARVSVPPPPLAPPLPTPSSSRGDSETPNDSIAPARLPLPRPRADSVPQDSSPRESLTELHVVPAVVKDDSMVDAGFVVAEPLLEDDEFGEKELVVESSGEPRLALVVDDDDDVRRLLVKVLEGQNFRVVEASDGAAALAAVRDDSFSVIVLDAMLPKVHGFEVARRLRVSEAYQHIPVVMVSAEYRGWRFAEDAKANYGVYAYVEKPFKVSDVIDAVAGAIEPTSVRSEPTAMGQRASEHLEQGLIHYRAGRIDDAIKQLLAGLNVDPLAQQLHFQLGLVYAKGGRLFDAIQALESSLDIQPRFFPALKNVAVLYQNAGFRNKAIEMWERCLMAAPDDQTRASIREHLVTVF